MKSFRILAIAALAAVFFTGCMNLEKLLPNVGTWNMSEVNQKVYQDGTLATDTTIYDLGTITFNDDGTGSTTSDNQTTEFTWSYDGDAETITITEDSTVTTMDVLESSKKEIKTFNSTEFEFFGVTIKTDMTSTLTKP